VEAVEASLARIEALDGGLNAFISVRAEEALVEARALARFRGRGPLWGVPVAVKDVIDVAGTRTTAASRILADNVALRDADCVAGLRAAGAVVVGKLNTHEFAFGARTTSPHFGPARNPWDVERICGGSSGGSGAAAAAGLVPGTLGTDTAGSVRIPSCFCGVTGLRPSAGVVSNRGVVPVSWTFDAVGPIARTAEDCAILLDAIASGADAAGRLGEPVAGLRAGVVTALAEADQDPEVASAFAAAVDELRRLEVAVERVDVPLLAEAGTIQQLQMLPEAAAAHLRWLRTRLPDYGPDVRTRLLAGLLLPSTAYPTGLRARRLFRAGLASVLERVDILLAPAMPIPAPRLDEERVDIGGREILYRLALIPFNSPWSLAGLPAASVPCGLAQGLPAGMAVVGRPGEDATVLRVAHAYQSATAWHELRPALAPSF
jgi:aspartyl-tRNA(Asn)/glutamyl-tRNA(Gln) amidotransferase subunit A